MARRVVDELERWWLLSALPVKIEVCRAAGLQGRVAARRFSALTDEEKEAIEWQRKIM